MSGVHSPVLSPVSCVEIIDREEIASVLQFMDGSNSSHSNR